MKMSNLRVDSPVVRQVLEGESITFAALLAEAINKAKSSFGFNDTGTRWIVALEVRITGISFRSNNVFGDVPVNACSRKLFAMFKSNVMESHLKLDGNVMSMWHAITGEVNKLGGDTTNFTYGSAEYKIGYDNDSGLFSVTPVSTQDSPVLASGPTGVTTVAKFEIKG